MLLTAIAALTLLTSPGVAPPDSLGRPSRIETEIVKGLGVLRGPRVFVGVGELHGTNEAPLFVEALVAALRRQGYSVVLLLEEPPEPQPFYKAQNSTDAIKSLRASPFWGGAFQDGRAGIQSACARVRLASSAPDVQMIAIDGRRPGLSRDEAMAANIVEQLNTASAPKVAAVFWAGNFHVIKRPTQLGLSAFDIARSKLEGFKELRIDLEAQQGSAFNCQDGECAEHTIAGPPLGDVGFSEQAKNDWIYTFEKFSPQLPAIAVVDKQSPSIPACFQKS